MRLCSVEAAPIVGNLAFVGKAHVGHFHDARMESPLAHQVRSGGLCSLGLAHGPLVPLLNLLVGGDRLGIVVVGCGGGRLGGAPIRSLSFQC